MVMDPNFTAFFNSEDCFKFDDSDFLPAFDEFEDLASTFIFKDAPGDLDFMDHPFLPNDPNPDFVASKVDPPDDNGSSNEVVKYVNAILMEENVEQNSSMFYDPLALQATEKSLYDVIGEKYPVSPSQTPIYCNQNFKNPDEYFFGSSRDHGGDNNGSGAFSADSQWIVDPGEYEPSIHGYSFAHPFGTSFGSMESVNHNGSGLMSSSMSSHLVPNIFCDKYIILQLNKGIEEASNFLPNNNQLIFDLKRYALPPESKGGNLEVAVNVDDRETLYNGSKGIKNHHREDSSNLEEERNRKFSAVCGEESELSEMFDKVLLSDPKALPALCNDDEELLSEASKAAQPNRRPNESKGGKICRKKLGKKKEVVDIGTLLINCAQAVVSGDRGTAEQLKQIRQHASPTGDASQRLANVFINGLEARLAGTGSQIYADLASKKVSATEKLKAWELYLSGCPFNKLARIFANKTIVDLAMNSRKKKLHIIDFGILYGFQWPMVIQHLSNIPGGPPELRITGIDVPQPGFRPAEMVEETGRRLAKYCKRFNVKFQYHGIAHKWKTIKFEDLNINDDEVLVVNSLFRVNLLDDSLTEESTRDTVLKLITRMNPDIFVESIVNGTFNSPYFINRFREALLFFSSLFDMFEANIPRDNLERIFFEQEFCGRDIINIVACEEKGKRLERPETYKQCHVRNMRVGLRILPLSRELMKNFRCKVKADHHKDFVLDEDAQWMLQGWKGRIFCASSCWVPA